MKKVLGTENPADLMTKLLSKAEIISRLKGMNLRLESRGDVMGVWPVEVDSRRRKGKGVVSFKGYTGW